MPRITIQPLGVAVEARPQDTIMAAAQAQGYYWPTTCGGHGRCTTCALTVVRGQENLSEMGRSERQAIEAGLGSAALARSMRLACQAHVFGDVEVLKPGVRPDWHAKASSPELPELGRRADSQ